MGHQENESRDRRAARVSALARAFAAALVGGDEVAAEIVIREAMDAKLGAGEIDDEIIAPALWLVGALWERGEITVADEHLASEISLRVLALHREVTRVALDRRDHHIMLATPSGERHTIALRMAAELLRAAGYPIVMLGADVPGRALVAGVRRHRPDILCLSATLPGMSGPMHSAIDEVQQAMPATQFIIGGRSLAAEISSRPEIVVCRRVSDVVEAADASVKHAQVN
jgi:MerR family transcriptional regulator, light-induced transcriptional regulator